MMHSIKSSAVSSRLNMIIILNSTTTGCSTTTNLCNLSRQIYTSALMAKFQTDTDLVHRSVMYGRITVPTRPNEPRVPSNPEFGITHLHRQKLADKPSELGDDAGKKKLRETVSKAMQIYLERAKAHNEFMQTAQDEFEFGRRHLANMMGINETTMTQKDINMAIRYLMPSGIFDKRAHPRMQPPSEIYPTIKEAQFAPNGRPFNSLFYTSKANFFKACYDLEEEMAKVKAHEDVQVKCGIHKPPPEAKIDLKITAWKTHKEMKRLFLERIEERRYEQFISALERLIDQPYSALSTSFIMSFRNEVQTAAALMNVEPLKFDEDGRPYMDAIGYRKLCVAKVTVRGNGTGLVNINGRDLLYFPNIQDREQIMTPLKFTDLLHKVDIECETMYREDLFEHSEDIGKFPRHANKPRPLGVTCQSGAIRHGISLALKSFIDRETMEKMRQVGLLTHDSRQRERKKWGQEGARRKYTWKKR